MVADSSLEKARAAQRRAAKLIAQLIQDDEYGDGNDWDEVTNRLIKFAEDFADSAAALEREQCAQIAKEHATFCTARNCSCGNAIAYSIGARGERKARENG